MLTSAQKPHMCQPLPVTGGAIHQIIFAENGMECQNLCTLVRTLCSLYIYMFKAVSVVFALSGIQIFVVVCISICRN